MSFNLYSWSYRRKISIIANLCIDDESLINSFAISGNGYLTTGIDIGTEPWTDRSYHITSISDCLKQKPFFKGPHHQSSVTLTYSGNAVIDVFVCRDGRDSISNLTSQGFEQISSLVCNTSLSESGSNPRKILHKKISQGESFTLYDTAGHGTDFAIFSCDCVESEPIVGYQILLKIGESSGSSDFDFHLDNKSAKFPSQQNDSGDLRFTLDDGITLLPFWVEKVEGESPNRTAYVWIRINADLSIGQNIYCYFGNPNAENVSNGEETFELFDVQGIVAFYHMDEESWNGTEGEVKDETGINNGTSHGGATTVENGKFSRAGSFDGSNDYIDCGNNESLNLNDEFSVEAWIKPLKKDDFQTPLSKGSHSSDSGWTLDFRTDERFIFRLRDNDGYGTLSSVISINKWHHVIGIRYDNTIKIYIDGTLHDVNDSVGGVSALSSEHFKIGCRSGSNPEYFKGLIDEVRIYNRALTEEEISKLYNGYMQNMGGVFNVRKYISFDYISFSLETIEMLRSASYLGGTVCDKNGMPIVGKSVKIFFLNRDTGELIESTTSDERSGRWFKKFTFPAGTEILTVFALEGDYGEDTDIATSELLTTE